VTTPQAGDDARQSIDEVQSEFDLKLHTRELVARGFRQVVTSVTICVVAYFLYKSIEAAAGTTTLADLSLKFLSNVKINIAVSWSVGITGVGYGVWQRRVRRTTVERLAARVKELEEKIDPRRSSSSLTPRGETKPEDR
jgi:hypothetical protein